MNNQNIDNNFPDPLKDGEGEALYQIMDSFPLQLIEFLIKYKNIYKPREIKLETGADPIILLSVNNKEYLLDNSVKEYPELKDKREWLDELSDDELSYYIPFADYNKDFWNNAYKGLILYHATSPENVKSIKKQGLRKSSRTRAISNRWMQDAVFTSYEEDSLSSYGDFVIGIDVGKMKEDGYMPNVSQEEPFEETNMREQLANKIGIDEYYPDEQYASEGLRTDTVCFFGDIPPKYLIFPKKNKTSYSIMFIKKYCNKMFSLNHSYSRNWAKNNCRFSNINTAQILLNNTEKNIFSFLLEANKKLKLDTTFRVAGGWVRDKLLGQENDDIDIALDNIRGEDFANKLRQFEGHPALGKSYIVKENPEQSKHIGSATIEIYGIKIDFVNLREEKYDPKSRIPTIVMATGPNAAEKDAKRRDLTINSLFYNINTNRIEDYVGGLKDLKDMRLKAPDDPKKTLLEDPLRALRWIRFKSKYNDSILDPSLLIALSDSKVHSAYKTKVSPSRSLPELKKIMGGADPVNAIKIIFDTGIYKSVFNSPEFNKLLDLKMDQKNVHHKHNLIDHTFSVMDNLNKIMSTENVDQDTRMLMNFAALFHDFGKASPGIQQPKKNSHNEMSYYGHDQVSADIAEEVFKRIGMGDKERKLIVQIIKNHMVHDAPKPPSESIKAEMPSEIKDKETKRYYSWMHKFLSKLQKIEKGSKNEKSYDIKEIADLTLMHNEADSIGTGTRNEEELHNLKRHRKNINEYYNYWGNMNKLLSGDDIISMFPNLDPKLRLNGESFVSDILKRLKEKQAIGTINSKEDAIKFVENIKKHINKTYGVSKKENMK